MKKFFCFFFALFIISINSYSQPLQPFGLPDVMNKINILQYDINGLKPMILSLDSFPVYTGFPKHISGTTFEGSIFCNMDNDPEMEIVININYTVQAFNLDGSSVTGWPKTVSSYVAEGAPAFGDIDGDGYGEIVVTNHGLTSGGYIYAYKRDGTLCTGFPINHGYSSRTPVLADVNNDGKMEIIVNKRAATSQVYIYKGDGTVLTGWPKNLNSVPASSCAVGDIDGDNIPEIIAESYNSIFAWKPSGDSIPGFPFSMPGGDVNSYSSPVLADINGDTYREIIFGTHNSSTGGGNVYVLKKDGTVQTGWPKTVSSWIYGPPAVGYIDNDNYLDIAIGDQVLSMSPSDFVYAWDRNGNPLTGFPIGPFNAINCQISLTDIDGDNQTELIFDDNSYSTTTGFGQYLAYNHDGTPVTGWPLNTIGTTFFTTPCFTDMNRDGNLDIVGTGIEGTSPNQYTNVYLWNTGQAYHYSKIYIPMWQYNSRHNGVFGDIPPIVGISNTNKNIPDKFELMQNYPNPFNPTTNIRYRVPSGSITNNSYVSLKVYNILGKEIATLVNEYKKTGVYEFNFDAGNLSSGIYFYKINAEGFSETKIMTLIK
jgi:hypothetical protein